jgi:hypothetical protein
MIKGDCLCGAVTIEVAKAPETVTSCNCSACRRLGGIYAYYPPEEVRISGPTVGFIRHDLPDGEAPGLTLHHCPTCGCTTSWRRPACAGSTGPTPGPIWTRAERTGD